MPDDLKKQKEKKEPKEQRRRRGRHNPAPVEKKVDRVPEAPKAIAAPEKPAYEPPPPEFYKNLKRETDEILKITEEANTKYKKKEIQSNWAKYEMPIESYEEIDEQENLGADYEALIQAPLSVGAHFQFKHEKSWDISTGSSPYDKYFDITMDNLATALSTIAFYERNKIDKKLFNDSDIQSMNHRAIKFKQKYYDDKKFTTPDLEVQDKIKNTLLCDNNNTIEINKDDEVEGKNTNDEVRNQLKDINLQDCEEQEIPTELDNTVVQSDVPLEKAASIDAPNSVVNHYNQNVSKVINKTDSLESLNEDSATEIVNKTKNFNTLVDNDFDEIKQNEVDNKKEVEVKQNDSNCQEESEVQIKPDVVPKESHKALSPQKEIKSNPIIESPEDLEKWLDDFLDG